jgi:hypothetical protein
VFISADDFNASFSSPDQDSLFELDIMMRYTISELVASVLYTRSVQVFPELLK